jgi:Bifunctional DNA primase/polymerase, N-terminal
MAWWASYRAVYRAELKASALGMAGHGWPLLPGTYWQSDRWTGVADAPRTGPAAVPPGGVAEATDDPAAIDAWWTERPYSVLLATGSVVDVLEVSALVGRRVCAMLREVGMVVPVAATPVGRWWFVVRAGEALRPELASRPDLMLHGRGAWVAAPPSQGPQGVVHWRVSPTACDWHLPESYDLQAVVLDALGPRGAVPVPGASAGSVGTGVRS